jgi:hypothetical protein
MRVNLKVPFAEKELAKKLGTRWDAARKIWYIESQPDMTPFSRWSPTPHEGSGGDEFAPKASPVRQQKSTGKVIVGSEYHECPRVCDCLPWDDCVKCRSSVLPG